MSTPTDRQVIDAHNALDRIYQHLLFDKDVNLKALDDAVSAVHRVLPPKPELPTMEGVEWDNELHYLAEAMVGGTKLIMLSPDLGGWIRTFNPKTGKVMPVLEPRDVTPTGKRYALTEVQDD